MARVYKTQVKLDHGAYPTVQELALVAIVERLEALVETVDEKALMLVAAIKDKK